MFLQGQKELQDNSFIKISNEMKGAIQNARTWAEEKLGLETVQMIATSNSIDHGELTTGAMIAVLVPEELKKYAERKMSDYNKENRLTYLFPITHIESDDVDGDLTGGLFV